MDCEIVNPLLTLFDKRVSVYLPGQFADLASDLLQGLVDGDSAYWNGAITDNPLTGLMNVVSSGKVHQCVTSPITAPYGLFNLFTDA